MFPDGSARAGGDDSGRLGADVSGPPSPGGSGGGTPDGISGGGTPLPTIDPGTNLWLLISLQSNAVVVTFSNTVANFPYLLLASTNVNGPWFTNQSFLATNTVSIAPQPIPTDSAAALFFLGMQATPGTLKWSVFLGGSGDALATGGGIDSSPEIGPDGTIYITTTSNILYAIDPFTGTVIWTNTIFTNDTAASGGLMGAEISSSPAMGANLTNYVGSYDGRLYAVDGNGITAWALNLGVSIFSSPAIGPDGTIYVGTDDTDTNIPSGFFAITNNAVKWAFYPIDDSGEGNYGDVDSSPAIGSDGTIYFLAEGDRFYALTSNGNVKWFISMIGHSEPDSSAAIASDGTVYVGGGSGTSYLYAINSDGSLKWVYDTYPDNYLIETGVQGSPVIGPDGTVYVKTSGQYSPGGELFAINPDGTLKWSTSSLNGVWTTYSTGAPAVSADGTVYVGSLDDNLYAITNSGTNVGIAWAFPTGGPIFSAPVIGNDGTVYIGSEDGNLYAVWGASGLATNSPWPMFHKNQTHTGLQTPTVPAPPDCGAPFVHGAALTTDGFGNPTSFSFDADATNTGTWNVFASSDLTNWTEAGQLNLGGDGFGDGNGVGTFTTNFVSTLTNQFYLLANGECPSNSCCSRVIGFVNVTVAPGTNLIADQLYDVQQVLVMNSLYPLFQNQFGEEQNGAAILTWNGQSFDTNIDIYDPENGTRWYYSGSATVGKPYTTALLPGAGVFFNNATNSSYILSFAGLIREEQIFQIQAKTNYLSATLPIAGAITNICAYVPHDRDLVQLWNTNSQSFSNYAFTAGVWSNGCPVVGLGQGFVLVTTNFTTWTNTWHQVFSCSGP
jgi:outer membrane protein assembly factor BamB